MSKFVTLITTAALIFASASLPACAQSAAPSGAGAVGSSSLTPAKEKLIKRILELWHVENVGMVMLKQPVMESLRQSRSLLQGRVSAEKQEATMNEINQDAENFLKESAPVVHASAQKLIPAVVVPLMAEKFSEEELRQIVAMLDSPVKSKFEMIAPELEKSLGTKIATDTGGVINPKLAELTQQIGLRMRTAIAP